LTKLDYYSGTLQLSGATLIGGQAASLTYYSSNSTTANGNFLKTIAWSPGPSWGIGYDKGLPKVAAPLVAWSDWPVAQSDAALRREASQKRFAFSPWVNK